jgi:hypothetical protein
MCAVELVHSGELGLNHNPRCSSQVASESGTYCALCGCGWIEPVTSEGFGIASAFLVPRFATSTPTLVDFIPSSTSSTAQTDDSHDDFAADGLNDDEDEDDHTVEGGLPFDGAPQRRIAIVASFASADGSSIPPVQIVLSDTNLRLGLARALSVLAGARRSDGADASFVQEGSGGSTTVIGDYVLGDMDSVIAALLQADVGRGAGAPPAEEPIIAGLNHIGIADVPADETCAVCLERIHTAAPPAETTLADDASNLVTMPCLHIFHQGCLEPWLRLHGVCPSCRAPISASARSNA